MKKTILFGLCLWTFYGNSDVDVTLIGRVKYADGIGRLVIGVADCIKDSLSFNHRRLPKKDCFDFSDVPTDIEVALKNPDTTPGNVSLLLFPLWWKNFSAVDLVPKESAIKIAYSMVESTKVPDKWVNILNEQFDAAVVPDSFYKEVYATSGVTIPVFVLPHGVYLADFLAEPSSVRDAGRPFTFGISAGFWQRKNQTVLLEAFCAEFKNNPAVHLVMHGRSGNHSYEKLLQQKLSEMNATNVYLIKSTLSDKEYKDLLKSFDCYVLLSKAEGFSVTPKETIALGIPTIITNNTAHRTICESGYVYGVPSELRKTATYSGLGLGDCGDDFNCTVEDARKALREVYKLCLLKKSITRKMWVQKYLWSSVKNRFITLLSLMK